MADSIVRWSAAAPAQTTPGEPNYCLVSVYDVEDEVNQFRIVVEGTAGKGLRFWSR